MPIYQPIEQRFKKFFTRGKKSACWLWTGACTQDGYGMLGVFRQKTHIRAHRFSYSFYKGPIPEGLFVMHTCDTPACVNPHHLKIGTNQDNIDDSKRKGRRRVGEKVWNAKLRASDIPLIRADMRKTREIALAYDIDQKIILDIKRRKRWQHVK